LITNEVFLKKKKIRKTIKLKTHVKVYIQKDGTISICDLLDDFVDIAYKIDPDNERITHLHRKEPKSLKTLSKSKM